MDRADIDEGVVRALLRDQHPDLADLEIQPVSSGWDNQMWRLGEELAVRLPMTGRAPDLLRKEFRWLPGLAEHLPLPVPTPRRLGEPSARFPRPWTVATWVPGVPADRAEVRDAERSVTDLAGFLRDLHRTAPDDAPREAERGVPLVELAGVFESRLARVAGLVDVPQVRKLWRQAVAAPRWTGPPVWIHADLHPANALITDGAIRGIVDFGDLCAGDPATDLAAAWTLLPRGAAAGFFSAYAAMPRERAQANALGTVDRARGWAVLSALTLVSVGQAWDRGLPGGQPTWGRAGRRILERLHS